MNVIDGILNAIKDLTKRISRLEVQDHINTNPLSLPDDLYLKADDSHIYFGVADDVNLYRGAAQTLKTDSKFIVSRTISGAGGKDVISTLLTSYVSGESGPVFGLQVSSVMGGAIGGVTEGGGWTGALLFYSHVNVADNTIGSGVVEGMRLDSSQVLWIGSGAGKDTNLYRYGANQLATDDMFIVNKAGNDMVEMKVIDNYSGQVGGSDVATAAIRIGSVNYFCTIATILPATYYADSEQLCFYTPQAINDNTQIMRMKIMPFTGRIGIGEASPAAYLDVQQPSGSAGIAVLQLHQGDGDQEFIDFIGAAQANFNNSIATGVFGTWTHSGGIRIAINGVDYWLPYYTCV